VCVLAYRKLKDQERQGQLIKERIEERKRRKQQQETSLTESRRNGAVVVTESRRNGGVVVHVSESNDAFNPFDKY